MYKKEGNWEKPIEREQVQNIIFFSAFLKLGLSGNEKRKLFFNEAHSLHSLLMEFTVLQNCFKLLLHYTYTT